MDIALSYLKHLFDSGYFQLAHNDCAHLWPPDHPACVPGETWASVMEFLTREGLLQIRHLPEGLAPHPRDGLNTWCFELTPKGLDYCQGAQLPAPPAEPGPCHLCRRCTEVCEAGAIAFREGKARILTSKCMGCARCVQVCPLTARGIRSSLYTPLS